MRIDFSTPVTWETAKSAAAAFWSWWIGELRSLLPPAAAVAVDRLVPRWSVVTEGSIWRLHRRGDVNSGIPIDTNEPAAVIREHLERLEPDALASRVETTLAASDVLVRTVRLPASAAAHVRSVVQLQLERLSPFPAGDVRFDCQTTGEDDGDIEVEVGIVPRATLDDYQARLAGYGLSAAAFRFGALSFRPSRTIWSRRRVMQVVLLAAVLVLWTGVFVLAPIMREREIDALADDVARLRGPAQEASAARDEISRLRVPVGAVSAELDKPDLLESLRTLTDAVPDNTHLTELTLDRSKVAFTAIGPDERHLVAELGRADGFAKPHVLSTATNTAGEFAVEAGLVTTGPGNP